MTRDTAWYFEDNPRRRHDPPRCTKDTLQSFQMAPAAHSSLSRPKTPLSPLRPALLTGGGPSRPVPPRSAAVGESHAGRGMRRGAE